MKKSSKLPRKIPESPTPASTVVLSRREVLSGIGSAATYVSLSPLLHAVESKPHLQSLTTDICSPNPLPIPGGFNAKETFGPRFPDKFIHLFLPGPGAEPSTIFNFKGKLGIQSIQGTGTRTELDPFTGEPISETAGLPFATDLRFMDGVYIGADGKQHEGTYAFF
jgi:hypothetical protein